MINVTKAHLPPLDEYVSYLQGIWERAWLTNYGPLVLELEEKLRDYLGVKHLFFVSNGTTALQIAIKVLNLQGEILTTPFSYVATTSSIVWENCTPVFTDINRDTLCLNPMLLEEKITPNTKAIIATHVYGNACDVEHIEAIANKHRLKVIYDAAHAFGVRYNNESIVKFGDISTLSFHATKLFHTGEGGAIVTNDDELAHKISYAMNFGHNGPEKFFGLGVNGKNSELHAAMGLCILPRIEQLIRKRKQISELYDQLLAGQGLEKPLIREEVTYNYSYYPVIFCNEEQLLAVQESLNEHNIYPRRYFYPSLNSLDYVKHVKMPVAEQVASRILCLPLYHELTDESVFQISDIIRKRLEQFTGYSQEKYLP